MAETKSNPFGGLIDLSSTPIAKAARGAVRVYEEALVELLRGCTATHGVAVTFYVVERGSFAANETGDLAYQNEKQRIGAILRSHAREAGLVKIGIDWHPEGCYPQISLKG
jgi:hypothetical protein